MTTTHYGQGIVIPEGQRYETDDRADIARRTAEREAAERQERAEAFLETEESDRRTVAEQFGIGAAMRSYHEQGGRAAIRWVVTAIPVEDEGDPYDGLPNNGYARRQA
jgi:hypothetical protein